MTQQEQENFLESLEVALSWMRAIQDRLKANDNTQGPRDALETRLRETEKIHQSEHEGRVKMDMALVAAEALLQSGDEVLRNDTYTRLKDLKLQWEETSTYIVHCHSRIEWVWLHWSEYLKAYEEFELWLTKQQSSLDVQVELQLGVKEKLWQVDQQRVIVSDMHIQAELLERLLDEAAALYNRTQDPSVEPQAQARLQEAYNSVRDRAEERLSLLQKMAEEHQFYQGCLQRFQSWLLSKTKELTDLMEKDDTSENKLKALQALDDSVASEEKTLLHIESMMEAVRASTSPAGAEVVVEEAEELRLGWQRLRQGLCEADEGLRSSLDSHSQYVARCQRLGEDIGRLRLLMQSLDQELQESQKGGDRNDHTEEQMVGQWQKYMGVRNTLAGEDSQVELLKAQLKELFRFSEDSRHLSDDVLAVVKEHQSVKCKAMRLCSESESGLRSILQDPLLVYAQWCHSVSNILETSAEVTDFSHTAMLVLTIERLLKDSMQLQERLRLLQVKQELLDSVFGPDKSDGLQDELSAAVRNRELLHTQLLQRKSRLQGVISRTKDFGEAYELIHAKMTELQDRLVSSDGPQPDILAKKSQLDQFKVIQKDLEDCEAHILALEALVLSSPNNRIQFERLNAEWKHHHKTVRLKVHESEESIVDHEDFHDSLLNIEKWLMIMKQKVESFRSPAGEWSIEGRQHEAERALGEFPEWELQLQQMEVQGHMVLKNTSGEGQVHILRDMKHLRESWLALYNLSLKLHSLMNGSIEKTDSVFWRDAGLTADTSLPSEPSENEGDRTGGSIRKRGQQQDKIAEAYRRERGVLEGQAEEAALETGWFQGSSEGHFNLAPQDVACYSSSSRVEDKGCDFQGDKVDSSALSIRSRVGQKVSIDSNSDGSPEGGKSPGSDSSILVADRRAAFSTKISCSEEGRKSCVEGSADTGKGRSPEETFILFRRDSAKQASTATMQQTTVLQGDNEQHMSRIRQFETWLSNESELLSGILSTKGLKLSVKQLKSQQHTLEALRAGAAWGQEQFQLLLQESQSNETGSEAADVSFEDLRYRWMLHKSKLKDVGKLRANASNKKIQANKEKPAIAEKKPGLLQRVCQLALPLWLLLLALLVLVFLLPLMDEGNSCSLSNNFARSFNIMLRYEGPPPT